MSDYYSGNAIIDTTEIDEVYSPVDKEIIEVWFIEKLESSYDHGEQVEYEIHAITLDKHHDDFCPIANWFKNYMIQLNKKQQIERNQSEYNKYLELKAKYEKTE